MDPQPATSPPPTDIPIVPETAKDSHGITIAALAVFILLALGAVAFLYYQNQQLKSMLAGFQTPAPTPAVTADPTANWKTYTNTKLGISFQYPESLIVSGDSESNGVSLGLEGTGGLSFEVEKIPKTTVAKAFVNDSEQYDGLLGQNDPKPTLTSITIDSKPAKETVFKEAALGVDMRVIYIQISDNVIKILLPAYKDSPPEKILSTFKFIESPTASPTAEPIACTMEAKICPDGSSVGRTGPNCEFAPCPIP